MILIADSGSTKTDWALVFPVIDKGQKAYRHVLVKTQGINPFHQSADEIRYILGQELRPLLETIAGTEVQGASADNIIRLIEFVAFYGSGCTEATLPTMKDCLSFLFPNARIEVASDLLGAARSLCAHHSGIVCILGTGSNSCWYDGSRIVANIPPLGYILGDEGSGAVLGKLFFNKMFKGSLPIHIKEMYQRETGLDYADIISRIYREPLANRFLADTAKFIMRNISTGEMHRLVVDNFNAFFRNNICQYNEQAGKRISAVGSIAYFFREQLGQSASLNGYEVVEVQRSPMEGLIRYHCPHLSKEERE